MLVIAQHATDSITDNILSLQSGQIGIMCVILAIYIPLMGMYNCIL